ncbi:MAG TPA: SpoIIE family protein phosphatase [Candidatus Ozemobacteraceae bacterium]|nr:SpoIIE family protein phosphatase [Candidatus Ozemobacteraceae bacterium]
MFHQRSLGGVVIYNTDDNRMMNADILELLNFLLNGFSAALRVAYNYQEKLETIKALEGLIARLDNQDKLLEEMVDIIKRLLKVERISFLTVDSDSRTLSIKNSYGIRAEVVRSMQIPIGEGISGYVAETGETLRIDNIEESESKFKKRSLEHYFNRSLLSVPLITTESDGRPKVLGVINVNNKTNGLTFNQQDQQMLESIAHLVVAALTNIDLTNAKHEHDLLQQQLDNARDVQMALLPRKFSNMPPELDMFAKSEPAIQIGGDFFDGIKLPDGRWLAAIGDVSGKGMSAAIIMAMSRIILRTVVHETSEPVKIMERMHEYLSRDISDYYFVTMQIVVIDPATGSAEMVSAGHGPLLGRLGGSLVQLESMGGFPLAVGGSGVTFESVAFRVQPGDQLLFFTDGLPEEYAPNREMFGLERTKELFTASRGLPPKDLVERFFSAAEQWRAGGDAHDDLTIMAVEYRGVTQ